MDGDLSKFRPQMMASDEGFAIYQDFLGGLDTAQLANLAHSVINNIANLTDHLRRWAKKRGQDPRLINQILANSRPMQIITDLSNNDKHGYPPRDRGHSGVAPKIVGMTRVLKQTTGSAAGSSIGGVVTPTGIQQIASGGESSSVVITASVVDDHDQVLGDLYEIELEALKVWEQELRALGILRP